MQEGTVRFLVELCICPSWYYMENISLEIIIVCRNKKFKYMKKNLKLESKTRSLFRREKVFFFLRSHPLNRTHLCHVISECDFEIVLNVSSQLNRTQPTQAVIYRALHILQSLCLPCAAPTARTVYLPSH